MKDRQNRISQIVRERRGGSMRPVFLESVSAALGTKLLVTDLVSLEVTDELRSLAGRHYKAVKNRQELSFADYFPSSAKEYVLSLICKLDSPPPGETATMLFRQSEYCGGISASAEIILSRVKHLLGVDGDGMIVVASNLQNGLSLDFTPDDPDNCYEVVVWGENWPIRLLTLS